MLIGLAAIIGYFIAFVIVALALYSTYRNSKETHTLEDSTTVTDKFKNGSAEGQGTLTSAKGDKYIGTVKDGKPAGQGTLTFADGNKYIGEFKNGMGEVQGILTLANGGKYIGEFKNGKPEGQGTLFFADGTVESESRINWTL